jgi:hypothetical protein
LGRIARRDDVVFARATLRECAPHSIDLSSKIRFFDGEARPHASNEFIFVDNFAGALNQRNENFKGSTSERNWIVALKQ